MKSSLSAVVGAVLKADGTASLAADELRSRIVAHLDQLGIKVLFPKGEDEDETATEEAREPDPPEPEVRYPHGEISTVEVRTYAEPAEFVIVAPVIRTGAGWESPLYLFRRAEQNWRLMLVDDDPPDYEAISSDHQFALSPADAKGSVFIVAANFSGGIHSTVAALEYRVVRPGRNPHSPKTLLRGDTAARRMYGPYFIRTQADRFEIEFPSEAVDRNGKFDTDEITGTRVLRFKVEGAAVKLVERRQLKPHEFPIPASADE